MSIAAVYLTVMLGNFATGWFIYALWRINRNEHDWVAIAIAVFILVTVGIAAYAVRFPT